MRQAITTAQDFAVAQHCEQASTSGLLLQRLHRDETRANFAGLYATRAPALDSRIADEEKAAASIDCGRDTALVNRLQRLNVLRSIAYIRAAAILDIEQWLPYAAHLTDLDAKKDAIRRVVDDIENRSNLTFAWPGTILAVRNSLADLCQERDSLRWGEGKRPCPRISVSENERQFGAMIVKDIETFIAADDAPLPPGDAPAWIISFPAGGAEKPFCHIERREGAALLSADAGAGGTLSFAVGSDLPLSAMQSGASLPGHIRLEGYVGVDGLAAIIVERARLDLPGSSAGTPDAVPELTIGKMRFYPKVEGSALVLDAKANNPGSGDLILLSSALLNMPHISAILPAAEGREDVDADLQDIAALIKDMSHLRQAYRLCWH